MGKPCNLNSLKIKLSSIKALQQLKKRIKYSKHTSSFEYGTHFFKNFFTRIIKRIVNTFKGKYLYSGR